MTPLQLTLLMISGFCARWSQVACRTDGLTTAVMARRDNNAHYFPLEHINYLEDAVAISADHRGPSWYGYSTGVSSDSEGIGASASSSSAIHADHTASHSTSSEQASSRETKERVRRSRTYRECSPCPTDMILRHTNRGIKWICGMYQRAQRTFKSPCMMRYRNCQDGTMFVQISAHRCSEDTYHGRHWFYVYRV